MRHERHRAPGAPARRVQRNLVDVLDQYVGRVREVPRVVAVREERKAVARTDAIHVDAVERCARRTSRPSAAQQAHLVSLERETPEDLVQVDLGAAGLRILTILPVDDEDAHYMRPMRRASASSDAVDELRAPGGSVSLGEVHRFLNHHARRRLAAIQLRGSESQHAALDDAEPLEAPVGGDVGELGVERRSAARQLVDERTGELALVGRDGEVVPDAARDALERLVRPKIPRVERLQHAGACARLNPRPRHPVDRTGPPSPARRARRPTPCCRARRRRARGPARRRRR